MTYRIRWMIPRDYPEVLSIESARVDFPWTEDDLTRAYRRKNGVSMVAEHGERVVGYVIYAMYRHHIDVLNIAVHPAMRRRGVGRALIAKMQDKLSMQRRRRLTLLVRETNLDAQRWLRRLGLRAVGVERGVYPQTDEDAYLFEWRVGEGVTA